MPRLIEAARFENYTEVPDDRMVVITDIVNSTYAIDEGRYRDVNSCGAAVLTAIRNVTGKIKFPFIFGGDGAAMILPKEREPEVADALRRMTGFALTGYGFELRAGIGNISLMKREGFIFSMATYRFTGSYHQALFRGSGFEEAERRLKAGLHSTSFKIIDEPIMVMPDLTGFECKWSSIGSTRGLTLALLVKPVIRGEREAEVIDLILAEIFRIFGTEHDFNPLDRSELDIIDKKEAFSIDHLKVDDMIRMIISSTPEQKALLTELLDSWSMKGLVCYGMHVSDTAILTCVVDKDDSDIFHLIDGGNGGYALAAKQLKEKLNSRTAEL